MSRSYVAGFPSAYSECTRCNRSASPQSSSVANWSNTALSTSASQPLPGDVHLLRFGSAYDDALSLRHAQLRVKPIKGLLL